MTYRRENLVKEPPRIRGYRTIKIGLHRIRVALLPGGKTRAVALLHPAKHER